MKKGKKKKWIVAIVMLVALTGIVAIITLSGKVEAEVTTVEKGPVSKLIKEIGTVESDNSIIISSGFTGEIKGLSGFVGDMIDSGDLLLTDDKSVAHLDLKSLKAQLAGLKTSLSRAKAVTERNKTLHEQGALSKEEYESALVFEKELEAQVTSMMYSIESYAKASGDFGVISPIKGTITEVFVKEGEYVTVGAPLFEIADLDRLYIKANLISEDADMVQVGDRVIIYAKKDGNSYETDSSVRRIHLKAKDEVSGLGIVQKRVAVEIEMNPDISLRLGSDVDLAIVVEEKSDTLRVPVGSIFKKDGHSYVFVAYGGRALLRQVEKGVEGNDYIEIITGLKEGETIILSPGNDIEDGIRLR